MPPRLYKNKGGTATGNAGGGMGKRQKQHDILNNYNNGDDDDYDLSDNNNSDDAAAAGSWGVQRRMSPRIKKNKNRGSVDAAASAVGRMGKRQKQHSTKSCYRNAHDHDDSDTEDEDEKYEDFLPVTNAATKNKLVGQDSSELAGIIEAHRKAYMERAFPVKDVSTADNPQSKSGSILACRPQEDLDYIAYVVRHWQVGVDVRLMPPGHEKDELIEFRRKHKKGNKYIHQYVLEEIYVPGDDESQIVVRRVETKGQYAGKNRIVVSREKSFDAIDEWHRSNGHYGQDRTWGYCAEKYYNVTENMVKMYCKTCLTCMKKNPATRNKKGSIKPIRSWKFRDRFQVDLIDFRKLRKRDPFGVLMRWVLTLKDHATGLVYLTALPRKRPKLIAYRLQEIFGLIGYPKIFHTDNGKEFTAKEILTFLRQLNPNILAVTGRPRRPSDQGSVENMNKLVKRVLGSILAERRLAGENPNWTELLGAVAATINSQAGRGKNDVTSYEAVFGYLFNHQYSCTKEDARKCWTVNDIVHVTNDTEFKDNVTKEYNLSNVDEEEDSEYFSDDEVPDSEKEEVTDEYFYAHLMHDDNVTTTVDAAADNDDCNGANSGGDGDYDITKRLFDNTSNADDLMMANESQEDRKPPAKLQLGSDDEMWEVPSSQRGRTSSTFNLVPIDVAWLQKTGHGEDDDNLICRLCCDHCFEMNNHANFGVVVGNDSYIKRKILKSNEWFSHMFINGFLALVQHDAHISRPLYKDNNDIIKLVYRDYALNENESTFDHGDATHFVSVAFKHLHFVVLYYDIDKRQVIVFDGLNGSITYWSKQIINTIKMFGLQLLDATCLERMSNTKTTNKHGNLVNEMILELHFNDLGDPWVVSNDISFEQSDGVNCGPLACLKVMEIYGFLGNSIEDIGKSEGGYRGAVVDYYKNCLDRYDSVIKAELRKAKMKRIQQEAADEVSDHRAASIQEAAVSTSYPDEVSDRRAASMAKKNNKQQESALKEMKRAGKSAITSGAAPGAVVTLQVDHRTHSHAEGLLAIIYDVKPETGGVLVCCEHGVITHTGTKGDYWVPWDKYFVQAKKDEFIPLPTDLQTIRNMILSGKFQETSADCPRISYSKYHQISINAISPPKKTKGCKCRGGNCGKQCGCRKKQASCISGCSCNGNCNG